MVELNFFVNVFNNRYSGIYENSHNSLSTLLSCQYDLETLPSSRVSLQVTGFTGRKSWSAYDQWSYVHDRFFGGQNRYWKGRVHCASTSGILSGCNAKRKDAVWYLLIPGLRNKWGQQGGLQPHLLIFGRTPQQNPAAQTQKQRFTG